ncbi:MAG TPA: hypothetical protein VFX17_04480 [Patescibacteria group bacterium]|nr:hypothetical protein [Patescibacteria group bacterium]
MTTILANFKPKQIFAIAVIAALLSAYVVAPVPKAQAVLGVGDYDFNTEVGNIYDIAKDIGLAAAERIATNYANQYLQRFVNQLLDKYKIQNYLAYTQVLTDHYLTDYLRSKISDPDLQGIFTLMDATYIQGTPTGYTGGPDPRNALLPQLKKKIVDYYVKQGGIDPSFIENPPDNVTGQDYYSAAMSYYLNNPDFLEIALAGQLGEIQSAAAQASGQEVASGNGYKSSRSLGTCLADQTTGGDCSADSQQIIETIQNPGAFVQDFSNEAIKTIFQNNLGVDPNNVYSQVGSLLGNFIFNKLNLDNSGQGYVLSENGNTYVGNAGVTNPKDLDLDGDGIPDGQDSNNDGKLDSCYHGGNPPNCTNSSVSTSSTYFLPFCNALDQTKTQTQSFLDFVNQYGPSAFSDNQNLDNKDDTDIWSRKASVVNSSFQSLSSATENFHISYFDPIDIAISRYANYIQNVAGSLAKDHDLDLHTGLGLFGGGLGQGGGLNGLISNTTNINNYLNSIQVAMGGCAAAQLATASQVPAPVITDSSGSGGDSLDCSQAPNSLACSAPDHSDLVARVKAYLVAKGVGLSGNCGAFEITKRVAWALRSEGAGLMVTFHSSQCNGYASDIVAYNDNSGVDILGDTGGANNPQWSPEAPTSESGVYYAPPSDPGDPVGSY